MSSGDSLIEATDLAAGYGREPAIEGVTFTAGRGQRIGVLGPNGGGKTTLMRALTGELEPLRGRLEVRGRCATVPQTDRSRLDFPVSALDVATMGSLARLPWWRRPGRAEREAAGEALERVGLSEHSGATYGELSGGQRQRVLIARSLVQEAPVLLLDEPFAGLDAVSAGSLESLTAGLASEGRTVLIATHDLPQARRWERVLCLNRRQIAFGDPAEVLGREAVERTYGEAIVELPGGRLGLHPAHHHRDHEHGVGEQEGPW